MCWKWDILVQKAEAAADEEKSPRSRMHSLLMQERQLAKNTIIPNWSGIRHQESWRATETKQP